MTLRSDLQAKATADPAFAQILATYDEPAIIAAMPSTMTLVTTRVGAGTIMGSLGPVDGAAFIKRLRAGASDPTTLPEALRPFSDAISEILIVMDRGDMDLGVPAMRATVDVFASAGLLTTAAAAALKALGERHTPLDVIALRQAVFNNDGSRAI